MKMRGQGNSVPHGQQLSPLESEDESYTGTSGSYTDISAVSPRHQQQPQLSAAVRGAQRTPQEEQSGPTSGLQSSPSFGNRGAVQENQQEEGGEAVQKKSGVARGKQRALTMVNAALEAPAARMRAVKKAVVGKDSQRVTVYVFFCIALMHLLFVILSCALSQIDVAGGGCYTFWGFKKDCDSVSYTRRTSLIRNCSILRSILRTGAAFSIISILASTLTVVMSWILCIRLREAGRHFRGHTSYMDVDEMDNGGEETPVNNSSADSKQSREALDAGKLKKSMILVMSFSLAFELICWSMTASIHTNRYCDNIYQWSKTATYGVGFGIGLTAWLIELIAYIAFILLV
ncbi:hypothetical protein LSCM1_03162 [Leishmania martiniquensis]|uniref:Amastin-like protein n=1 Tax=Leishmania martiniquensis TaxID=1580590 RepID=A0A836KIS3_9TRYP|nr:hypothetical protein LSCM1_03162 [Leishmania martiniquensis]